MPSKVFWAQKSFLPPPQNQKIDYLKNPPKKSEHGGWSRQWLPLWCQTCRCNSSNPALAPCGKGNKFDYITLFYYVIF